MTRIPQRIHCLFSLAMLGTLFFASGLVSWMRSILVLYSKMACELRSEVQGYLADFVFYVASPT